jgi:hypothetical protein
MHHTNHRLSRVATTNIPGAHAPLGEGLALNDDTASLTQPLPLKGVETVLDSPFRLGLGHCLGESRDCPLLRGAGAGVPPSIVGRPSMHLEHQVVRQRMSATPATPAWFC